MTPLRRQAAHVQAAIDSLRRDYAAYSSSLEKVVDLGDQAVPTLIELMNGKEAIPIAEALGLLMNQSRAREAIPTLLHSVIPQAPVRSAAREALRRAGKDVLMPLLDELRDFAAAGDDEAVRNLLDVGVSLPEEAIDKLVTAILDLLRHQSSHIREAAADAIWRLGLPHGKPAIPVLRELVDTDADPEVRSAAGEALERLLPDWRDSQAEAASHR